MKIDFLKKRAEDFLTTVQYHFKEKKVSFGGFRFRASSSTLFKIYIGLEIEKFPSHSFLKRIIKSSGKSLQKRERG